MSCGQIVLATAPLLGHGALQLTQVVLEGVSQKAQL